MNKKVAIAAATLSLGNLAHAGFVLQLPLGPGNDGAGVAIVEVDGFGSFGSFVDAGNNGTGDLPGPATFEPQGSPRAEAVAVSVGAYAANGEARQLRTSGNLFGAGNEPAPAITDDNGTAVSSFTISDSNGVVFNVGLRQSIAELTDSNSNRSGSRLIQDYTFTNVSGAGATLDVARYIDADLGFDNSIDDGGGYLLLDNDDFVFVTDTENSNAGATGTTFVGLNGSSTSAELDDGFEVGGAPFADLLARVLSNQQLNDTVINDISPVDFFVDDDGTADSDNIAIGVSSLFQLAPNETVSYTDLTIFGFGAPADIIVAPEPDPDPIPAPASLLLIVAGLFIGRRRFNAKS